VQSFTQVSGIMNGTCNYILDNMTRKGVDYSVVLKQAQELGYAEADPSTDVDGIDTWHKTILSSGIAWGVTVDKTTVPVAGISKISALDVANFTTHGLVCKLMGTGKKENGAYRVYVQPTLVKAGDLEAAVPMNYNLVTFHGTVSGPMSLYGQGAGRYPTAYNVMQDLTDVLEGKGFYAPLGEKVAADNSEKLSYYVRGNWTGEVAEIWNGAVITAPVSVAHMHAWLKENGDAFIAAIR
jgi:homoserine dehydrogenase